MKLHFGYHTYLSIKEGNIDEGCKYCQDRLVNGNVKGTNENESEKSGAHFNADKKSPKLKETK